MKEIFKTDSPIRGFSSLCLGGGTQVFDKNKKQYSLFIKLLGAEPKESGEEVKIFTFGLFLVKNKHRLRAGFIKRHQAHVKV
jgi:hypothetical protein